MRLPIELLSELGTACRGLTLPRVRALHLPPVPWNGRKDGEFAALELEDGSIGLSYVLLDDTLATLALSPGRSAAAGNAEPAPLAGADALALAQGWAGAPGPRRAIGFAAVNALTRHLFDRAGFAPPTATDSIGGLAPRSGDHIGMVGLFPPLVKRMTGSGAQLTVLELREALTGDFPGFRCTLDPRALASCNKVLSTSTVLLNDTLDAVLDHCRAARQFAMIGPGAACLPDPLFRRGVSLLGGSWIEDGPAMLRALGAGAAWGLHARKFALSASDYPGITALVARMP